MKYKIYAGLSGGFGGATYQKTEDYQHLKMLTLLRQKSISLMKAVMVL